MNDEEIQSYTNLVPAELLKAFRASIREIQELPSDQEIRSLVDLYYSTQKVRVASNNAIKAIARGVDTGSPVLLHWFHEMLSIPEQSLKGLFKRYALSTETGKWSLGILGIGPVLAAGLLAHIDISHAPTVGHIWRYAGVDPTSTWGKGEKRPWNASLKTLVWKIGGQFVKLKHNERSFYYKVYAKRKAYEVERSEKGEMAEQAAGYLQAKNYSKNTEAYKAYSEGKLPDGQLDARARRYTAKLFLSHWHHVRYREVFHKEPPFPYPVSILGHGDFISPDEAA